MPPISNAAFAAVAAGVLVAAAVDVRTRRVPNALTAAMAATGIGLAATGTSGVPLWAAMVGLVLGLGLMLPGHLLGATGAGDVKLMAAVGAVVGPAVVVKAFLLTAIAGGVLAMVVAVRRRRFAATLAGTGKLLSRAPDGREELRSPARHNRFAYAPAIAAGSLLAMLIA